MVVLSVLLCLEPYLRCLASGVKVFANDVNACEDSVDPALITAYGVVSAVAVCLYFVGLLDLVALSNRLAVFVLSCRQVLPELYLFLLALGFFALTFGAAATAMDQNYPKFQSLPRGAAAFAAATLGIWNKDNVEKLERDEPWLLVLCVGWVLLTVVFLTNLLVAQLTAAYKVAHESSLGFARLNRAALLVAWMPYVRRRHWQSFLQSLHFEDRLEFNEGDVGLAGGLQLLEPAALHPSAEDTIRRYGGSTNEEAPWPAESRGGAREEDRFARLEALITKATKRAAARQRRSQLAAAAEAAEAEGSGVSSSTVE